MRIRRLELTNFRTFGHAVFEDIPDTVLLVSPNGRGKSSVLEAIAGAKDLVIPYHQDNYQFTEEV
jgi:predicted ATP-binding protein involved in virulence